MTSPIYVQLNGPHDMQKTKLNRNMRTIPAEDAGLFLPSGLLELSTAKTMNSMARNGVA